MRMFHKEANYGTTHQFSRLRPSPEAIKFIESQLIGMGTFSNASLHTSIRGVLR